jgi:hypothetical protein
MGTDGRHTSRSGALDEHGHSGGGDAAALPGRCDGVADLDLAIMRGTLVAAEPDEGAVGVVEEQVSPPRVVGASPGSLEGGWERLGEPDPVGFDGESEACCEHVVAGR